MVERLNAERHKSYRILNRAWLSGHLRTHAVEMSGTQTIRGYNCHSG